MRNRHQRQTISITRRVEKLNRADGAEITVDGQEIVAARWFEHETIKRLVSGQSAEVPLPRRDAIAFHLIAHWAEYGPWT